MEKAGIEANVSKFFDGTAAPSRLSLREQKECFALGRRRFLRKTRESECLQEAAPQCA
jgi:hypothetical protein